jgi:hypothetical protein
MSRWGKALLACALLAFVAQSASTAEIVHGANSLFVAPSVKLAWAMQRGATEEQTRVVVRVVNTASAYKSIEMVGVHPFSKSQKVMIPRQAFGGEVDLSVPRSGFAEYPSSEIHLFKADAAAAAGEPDLVVYYLGVPDTAPEFVTPQQVGDYLAKMLASAK